MSDIHGIYHYHRVGHDEREMELRPDGTIGTGADGAERRWELRQINRHQCLSIAGDYGEICRLKLEADGCWRGAWLKYEQMPVELIPRRLQPLRSLAARTSLDRVAHQYHYISYAQLVRDCAELARSLPPVRAVAGVPRSGMIPASLIALELNVPMVSIESLLSEVPVTIPLPRRRRAECSREGIVLVVDDTCASGRQVEQLRKLISHPVQFAAVYVEDRPVIAVDFYHSKLPPYAQCYEWTMFHDDNNQFLLVDLDGVLCDDWSGGNEDLNATAYLEFLNHVRPRRIPTYPLNGIVTNRLERHRPQTEAWLTRHGIQYGTLTMSPYETFDQRDRANDAAKRKANSYAADSSLHLFVESDDHQAQEIARLTGRPVFSIARNGIV